MTIITTPQGQTLSEFPFPKPVNLPVRMSKIGHLHPRKLPTMSRCPNCQGISWYNSGEEWRCCKCGMTVESLMDQPAHT